MSLVGEKRCRTIAFIFILFRPVKHYEYTNIQNIELFEPIRFKCIIEIMISELCPYIDLALNVLCNICYNNVISEIYGI